MTTPAAPPTDQAPEVDINGPFGISVKILRVSERAVLWTGALAGLGCAFGYILNTHGAVLLGLFGGIGTAAAIISKAARGT